MSGQDGLMLIVGVALGYYLVGHFMATKKVA